MAENIRKFFETRLSVKTGQSGDTQLSGVQCLSKRNQVTILVVVGLLLYLTYVALCFNNNVWTDEAFTIDLIKGNFGEIIRGTASDVHPPLYYLILKPVTMIFGSSLFVMKLVSIVPMIMTMAMAASLLYRSLGFREALLAELFLAAIPCTMEYAVQVRMYSWAIFFVTAMGFLCLGIAGGYAERGRFGISDDSLTVKDHNGEAREGAKRKAINRADVINTVLLGICGACCALTHYFAFAAALWIYGFTFLALLFTDRKRLGYWAGACVISLLVFLPWYPSMRIQVMGVSHNYWIEPITQKTWGEFLPFLFGMDIPYGDLIWGILLIAALVLAAVGLKGRRRVFSLLCLLVPVAVLLTGVTISNVMRPIFIIRYLLPCMGLVAVFLAVALGSIDFKPLFAALVFFCVAAIGVDFGVSVYREYTWTHTAETEAFLSEMVGESDVIAYNYEGYDFVYDYYWEDGKKVLWMDIDLDNCPYENIWLLDTIYNPFPTDEYLAGFGWAKEFWGNYGIEHNNFKIWRLYRKA